MCDSSLKLSVKERTTMTADFLPQNPQSEPGQHSPSPSFILFDCNRVVQLPPSKSLRHVCSRNQHLLRRRDLLIGKFKFPPNR